MSKIIATRLSELRRGDILIAVDGKKRSQPLTVQDPLGPIAPGSPVQGVRFEKPHAGSIDFVFYPSQMDGSQMEVERAGALRGEAS